MILGTLEMVEERKAGAGEGTYLLGFASSRGTREQTSSCHLESYYSQMGHAVANRLVDVYTIFFTLKNQ